MRSLMMILLPAVLIATGCVHSFYPGFTEDAAVSDPALVGAWTSVDAADSWQFSEGADGLYTMSVTDGEGLTGQFAASMFEVEGYRFLDVYPATEQFEHSGQNPYYLYHFLPMHTFLLVKSVEPELVLSMMDPEWVGNYLMENPDSMPAEMGEYLLLTGDTYQLQDFLAEVAPLEGAFVDGEPMQRAEVPAVAE